MIYKGIKLHNVAELEQREHLNGVILHRFPAEVRHSLSDKGRTKAVQSNSCELRFVTESASIRVTVSAYGSSGKVLVFCGDFFHSSHSLQAGAITTLNLEVPDRFVQVHEEVLRNQAFSPRVWRIFFDRFTAVFHDIDAYGHEIREPHRDEVPKLAFVAYGSSITHGAGALSHYNGYTQQAARRMETDVLNLGLSGSCLCEPEVADFIAGRSDWDFAFFELGVNMRSVLTVNEFEHRIKYLLDRVISRHPDKPVFITTIYPNRATYFKAEDDRMAVNEHQFNEVLRQYAAQKRHGKLHLFEGSEIMTDFTSLTSDLIHPSDYGHILMGEKLAALIRPILQRTGMEQQTFAKMDDSLRGGESHKRS
ncbi:SGNH/GDSL hydrolase family protein [Paenibacillus sp. GD4]|uniref:SGNH/GDSL hydrolase family protein n=1 Tax=Paenibacillus sp. GD4 TaxID=3068890 RepID=UPI002796C99F|nr:SGNH/GDSL hydrolase family protein [Paenibacillus sp. GD4]MDQ1912778.1 SGNH/GDSL hydrolase family protein [Paenibacillus sp. GD4]